MNRYYLLCALCVLSGAWCSPALAYIDTGKITHLLQNTGFAIEYQITGRGMAKFKDEYPYISRVVASRA